MQKIFVLDTNVLLHSADSIEGFADNIVVLPMAVIEELDKFKSRNDELGRNSRHVIRRIDALRQAGNLRDGVPLREGGMLRIVTWKRQPDDTGLDVDVPDNRILRVAYSLFRERDQKEHPVIFVSKDINARLKADALGIEAQDFEKQKINFDDLYTGYSEATVSTAAVDEFYKAESYTIPGVGTYPNEFVLLRDETNEKHTALGRVQKPGTLVHLSSKSERVWNIKPRSKEQRMALELLMDPSVQLVTLVGQAGTGKTLLALAAALQCTVRHQQYDRILVSRPIVPLGKDIGYLPGAKEEKLSHWMQPIFDNLTYLMRNGRGEEDEPAASVQSRIDELFDDDIIDLEALTYIRGRSIPRQYVVVDEAQNLTPHEVKTIVSRAGENTKMVLTGDPYQIDNPYLDSASNGLTYAAERLKEQAVHGHITLRKSERSNLAAVAAEFL